jgi:hypothetical protein
MPDNSDRAARAETAQRKAERDAKLRQVKQQETHLFLGLVRYLKPLAETYPELRKLFKDLTPELLPPQMKKRYRHIPRTEVTAKNLYLLEQETKARKLLEYEVLPEEPKKKKKRHHAHGYSGDPTTEQEPEFMDQDDRYRELLESNQVIKQFRENTADPKLKELSSLALIEEGVWGLNPQLIPHLTALDPTFDAFLAEEGARDAFRMQYEADAAQYDEREKKRIYKNPANDPEIKRVNWLTAQRTEQATKQQIATVWNARDPQKIGVNKTAIAASFSRQFLLQFAREFSEKALEYAAQLPELQAVLLLIQAEKDAPTTTTPKESDHLPEGLNYRSAALPASSNVGLETDLPTTPSPALSPASQQIPTTAQMKRNISRPSGAVGNSPRASEDDGMESRPNIRPNRRPTRRIRPPIPTSSLVTNLAKQAIMRNPYVIGAIIVIVLLILIIFFILSNGELPNADGTYSVHISKTGPTAVPNPKEKDLKKSDGSDITYKINVTYGGAADKIVVTDPIDQNADFIKAEGPGNATYDDKSHTVTWNILPGSSNSGSPSASQTQTGPQVYNFHSFIPSLIIPQTIYAQSNETTAGTIHNLGFGPSNAERVEAMIKKLRPTSPYLGHGNEIIQFAKEFNVDPLMIIITIKESQLCSDTGANSPGGSDPDNFNCGNITWEAAQDGADVGKWNAKPGVTVDGHLFTFVGTMKDGLGLFYDYIDNPLYRGKTLAEFYDIYNPCSDPANQAKGYACGAKEADEMLGYLRDYAGEPCSGSDCTIGSSPGGSGFENISELTLTVRPKTSDSWVINQAFAEVIGARAGLPGSSPGTGRPGQPLPSNDTAEIKRVMCTDYKVCPTELQIPEQRPNSDWTLPQLTALWNVVQRIYESDTYKSLAIGKYTLEVARGRCYPAGCDNTYGYYSGMTRPDWATKPNARLIVITDLSTQQQNPTLMEWLYAHEIGHSASGGDLSGGLTPELGMNEPYRRVAACGEQVSTYGGTNTNENNSEILSFYMTAAEEANAGYFGGAKNLKADFPCTYNAVRDAYFDGVEF